MHDPSPRNEIGKLIGKTARQWRRTVDRQLLPFGLTEATWLPLLHVARAAAPMRQKELAASLSLDNSSVVRLLNELQAAGLVERREEGVDRRAKAIVLTELGRTTVVKVERSARQVREKALAGLSDAELHAASLVIARIFESLQAMVPAEAAA
ncbi:MarR family transcriptional regulator [Rhodoferax koreense]|uniref:MarR family transcriptional regulator n=1 Tax=Rhodoferax koreensis TaxID=1842727 RepID=A0A1P8K4A8_9BURK|nr:MarR family transcriptional regulator [Rhodoferax koreense]